MSGIAHTHSIAISFGDCDPAGIVYYPNHFRWFDATFHALLFRLAGGHAALCERLGSIGLGLIDAGGSFRAPAVNGDRLDLEARIAGWSDRTFRIDYAGRIAGRLAVEGHEVRGVFMREGAGLRAAPVAPLRAILEAGAGAS